MAQPADEREWGPSERGYLLRAFLEKGPRYIDDIAKELGYSDRSGAWKICYRMRAAGLIQEEGKGLWSVVDIY